MRVLLVDDKYCAIENLEEILLNDGIKTEYAKNPEQAIRMMKKKEYQAIITDYDMGDLNGGDLIRIIKGENTEETEKIVKRLFVKEEYERFKEKYEDKPLIVFTGNAYIEDSALEGILLINKGMKNAEKEILEYIKEN